MSVEHADGSLDHLYPAFARLVKAILEQATRETTGKHGVDKFILFEGFRSQQRQDWLFAQGRTRPGPKVTQRRVSFHSSGLAADCYPVDTHGKIMWEAHDSIWQQYGHCIRCHIGVTWGGGWASFRDYPHVEANAAYRKIWTGPAQKWLKAQGLV